MINIPENKNIEDCKCPKCGIQSYIIFNDGGSLHCIDCDIYYHFCKKTNKSEEVEIHKCDTCNPFKDIEEIIFD